MKDVQSFERLFVLMQLEVSYYLLFATVTFPSLGIAVMSLAHNVEQNSRFRSHAEPLLKKRMHAEEKRARKTFGLRHDTFSY